VTPRSACSCTHSRSARWGSDPHGLSPWRPG
jgi:hypothetical protein